MALGISLGVRNQTLAETQLKLDAGDRVAGGIDHGHTDNGALRRRHRGAA
jgi:hypothetical protein